MLSIDFDKAGQQAGSLARCADGMQQQSAQLNHLIAEIRGAWQGDTAAIYLRKLEELAGKLEAHAKQCRQDASSFNARIGDIRQAEEEAKRALEDNQ